MEFAINVIQIDKKTNTASNGKPYVMLEVAYKDLSQGKVGSKKVMPFGTSQPVHKALSDAKQGDMFTVKTEKNAAGYWDWIGIKQEAPGTVAETTSIKTTAAPKSTYETPEERAIKQVYIVKQSSLTAALKFAELNKEKPTVEGVLNLAQELTDWVLSTQQAKQGMNAPAFTDMLDDMPQ